MDQRIAEYLHNYMDEESSIREEYSGRGMMGDTTTGLVLYQGGVLSIAEFLFANANQVDELQANGDLPLALGELKVDSMGKHIIVY